MMASVAVAQNPTPAAPLPKAESTVSAPEGYVIHQSADLGGHMDSLGGSKAMYSTLVNQTSGMRVLAETFEMHALPGTKATWVDHISGVGSGFGGDPYEFARLAASKGRAYEFTGLFRRDRQYFDYDLLANPNINPGVTMPYGMVNGVATAASVAWPQWNQSPVMFNTVRRMTDTNLTIHPVSRLAYRFGYSKNTFDGPSLTPGESVGKANSLLQELNRDSSDEFMGAVDWKPLQATRVTVEERVSHLKQDSYFVVAPGEFIAQEADGTKVSLGNWNSQTPFGISSCNTGSMGSAYTSATNYTLFSAPQTPGGLPVINAACDVISSYLRTQPTRQLYPTESLRFQSSSIKSVVMNGDVSYTQASLNMPSYYENYTGLNGATRSNTITGIGSGHRDVTSGDYGIIWQAMKNFSLSEQVNYSDAHQPGSQTNLTNTNLNTPTAAVTGNLGSETITYSGPLTSAAGSAAEGSGAVNVPLPGYFGQKFLTNSVTGTWDASEKATISLTYRYRNHMIAEGPPDNQPLPVAATTGGTVTINENSGILNAAFRPAANWDINGTVEVGYADNAFTPVGARQTKHYRVHTKYRPKPWATFTAAFNDLERHNNTNNNQSAVAQFTPPSGVVSTAHPTGIASTGTPYEGPIDHVDYTRIYSMGASLAPNEHYGLDLNYAYSDVYAATNICYLNGATATAPGAVQYANSTVCPNIWGRGATGVTEANGSALEDWFARDFQDAPTQYASAAIVLSPNKSLHTRLGYKVSDVSGTQFFNDARYVNGSMNSVYQSPFVNAAWTLHPGLTWKAEYDYYGYGEGGPSGSQYCSTTTSATAAVVPCTSLSAPTGLTEPTSGLTAPRTFHANNVTLSIHYEF
jgi:hypothetical protein